MYPIDPLIDARFLLRFILSEFFLVQAVKSDTRVAMPKINQTELNAILIPVPPLAEQRRIVAKVDELMALADTLEAQQQQKSRLAEAFAQACVVTFTGSEQPSKPQRMKAAKTKLVSHIKVAKIPSSYSEAPLAKMLSQIALVGGISEKGFSAKYVWQQSRLTIDAFYQQLKTEIAQGWIAPPDPATVVEVEVSAAKDKGSRLDTYFDGGMVTSERQKARRQTTKAD
jgi:type I restriction enzyme S subunit